MPEVKKKKSMENAVRFFCRLSYRSLCCLISINEVVLEVFSVFSFYLCVACRTHVRYYDLCI